jgi:hypothetical protein
LTVMGRFSDDARAALVEEWQRVRACGESSETFAQRHGITGRTLRSWCGRFQPRPPSAGDVARILKDTVARLQSMLAAIQRSADILPEVGSAGETPPQSLAPQSTGPASRVRSAERVVDTASQMRGVRAGSERSADTVTTDMLVVPPEDPIGSQGTSARASSSDPAAVDPMARQLIPAEAPVRKGPPIDWSDLLGDLI